MACQNSSALIWQTCLPSNFELLTLIIEYAIMLSFT